jgi:hypothetical protein
MITLCECGDLPREHIDGGKCESCEECEKFVCEYCHGKGKYTWEHQNAEGNDMIQGEQICECQLE